MSYSPLGGSMAALFTEVVKSTIKVRIHKYIEWQLVKIIIGHFDLENAKNEIS